MSGKLKHLGGGGGVNKDQVESPEEGCPSTSGCVPAHNTIHY